MPPGGNLGQRRSDRAIATDDYGHLSGQRTHCWRDSRDDYRDRPSWGDGRYHRRIPASNVTVVSATEITATSPLGSAGSANVAVTTAGGTATLASGYTYVPPPVANPVSATVAANSSSNGITLNITGGTASSVAVATAAGHGTATASGTTITYTPTSGYSGTDSFTYTATNEGGTSSVATVSITVMPPILALTPASGALSGGRAGSPLSQTVTASAGTAPYAFSVISGALPPGVVINPVSGTISGTPTATGTFNSTVSAQDTYGATGQASYSITVVCPLPSFTPPPGTILNGTTGVPFSQVISVTGASPGSLTASGTPIPGLSFDSATNSFQGIPTRPDSQNHAIDYTDPYGCAHAATYALVVSFPTITLAPAAGALPGAVTGVAYSQSFTASGGSAPYSYQVTTGTLPAGLTLDGATGALAGTPTAIGNASFTITATDTYGASTATAYSMTVAYPVVTLAPASGGLPSGVAGSSYSQAMSSTGGTAPYSFQKTAGLFPPGVTIDPASGMISGTPTARGTFNSTLEARDTYGAPGYASYSITVACPAPSFTPPSGTTLNGTTGVPFSQVISFPGASPGSFTASGTPIPGLSFDSATNSFQGTPTQRGSQNQVIDYADSFGCTHTATYLVTVSFPTITLAPAAGALPGAVTGVAYSQSFAASGGSAPYSYQVTAGTLPAGLTLDGATGALAGTPTASGSSNFTITATDTHGASTATAYSLSVAYPVVTLAPASGALPGGVTGSSYSQAVSSTGGTAPYSFQVSAGTRPPGLTLDPASGVISGTPTAAGTFNFTVSGTDVHGAAGSAVYSITVAFPNLSLTPAAGALPGGKTGVVYSQTISASGGTSPYSYAVSAGSLPSGLTLDATNGTINGTPTQAGHFNITITATDVYGATTANGYTLEVTLPAVALAPAAGALPGGKTGVAYSQAISASGGTSPYSYAVSAGSLPTGLTLDGTNGTISGTPTVAGNNGFSITATDTYGATGAAAYDLAIVPSLQPPVANAISSSVAANSSANAITLNITGDAAVSVAIGTAAAHGTASAAGMKISYTPAAGYSGTDSFTYTATNAAGTSAPAIVTITVAAPAFTFKPAAGSLGETMAGEDYRQQITATGGPAPMLYSVSAGTLPKGLTLNISTGELTGPLDAKSKGDYTFTIRAEDKNGAAGTATYSLTVTPREITVGDRVVDVPAGSTPSDIYLNRGATGGPFTGAELTFVEPANAGTATIIRGQLAQVGRASTPAGWYLQFTPNPAFSGKARVGFRLISALGTSNTGIVIYNLNFAAAQVADDIDTLVRGFVSTRQDLIASGIYVPGLLERRQMNGATDPVTARMTPSEDGMTANLSTSLAQIDAARDSADGIVGGLPRPFNAWVDLSFLAHNRDENGGKWGSFAMINLGADYLVSEKALIGLSFHYDRMTDPTDADAELTGNGWLAGPNASLELGKGVFWDTSLLYGGSSNDIDTAFWDGTFDTTRWMVDTEIKGQWNLDEATILTPKLRAVYFSETVDDYTVHNGSGDKIAIDGFDEEQFRVSLGAEIERAFALDNGSTVTPKLGLTAGYSGLDGSGAFGNLIAGVSLATADLWLLDFGLLFNLDEDGGKSAGGRAKASRQF